MEKVFEKETHEIFVAIAPILDKMTLCARYGAYDDKTATEFMLAILKSIDVIVIKYGKVKGTTKKN